MKIIAITRQKVICEMNWEEVGKCKDVEKELRPKYHGYRYVAFYSGGYCFVQKFIFHKAFPEVKI